MRPPSTSSAIPSPASRLGHVGGVQPGREDPGHRRLGRHGTAVGGGHRPQIGAPLVGHAGAVWSVAFSPDGKTLATGSANGTVHLWDVATGRQTGALRTTGAVYSVAFSPDGKTLATGSYDGTAQLWDVATRRQIGELQHRPDLDGLLVGVQPGREDPGHRQCRRHGAAMGRSHPPADRRTPARRHQLGLFGGLQPGRPDPGHRQLRRHGTAVGRSHRSADRRALASGDNHEFTRWPSARTGIPWPRATAMASYNCGTCATLRIRVISVCFGRRFLTPTEWARYVPGPAYQKTCP